MQKNISVKIISRIMLQDTISDTVITRKTQILLNKILALSQQSHHHQPDHRRINTVMEEKAIVVTAVWGTEFIVLHCRALL